MSGGARQRRVGAGAEGGGGGGCVRVATFNLRFVVDRWALRKPLVLSACRGVGADVYALQECLVGGEGWGQGSGDAVCGAVGAAEALHVAAGVEYLRHWGGCAGRLVAAAAPFRWMAAAAAALNEAYLERVVGRWLMPLFNSAAGPAVFLLLGTAWCFGNALVIGRRLRRRGGHRVLCIGAFRLAHAAAVELPCGGVAVIANVHTDSAAGGGDSRRAQAAQLCRWVDGLAAEAGAAAAVVLGDFNAPPGEPLYAEMLRGGFRSAYATAHGAEPVTFPTPLHGPSKAGEAPAKPECLDYVWVKGDVDVVAAGRFAADAAPDDPTLAPSDHIGLWADLAFR